MNDPDEDFGSLIDAVYELSDVDEITNVFSLFCYNHRVMPGSEEFDDLFGLIMCACADRIKEKTIIKFRNHIDEYE